MDNDKQIFINNIQLKYNHDDIIKINYFANLLSNKYNDVNNKIINITMDNLTNVDDINILIHCIMYNDYKQINHLNIYDLCMIIDFFQDPEIIKQFNLYLNHLIINVYSDEYLNFTKSFEDMQHTIPLQTYTTYIIMNIYSSYIWALIDFRNIIKVIYVLSLKQEYLEICKQIIDKLIFKGSYANAIKLYEYYCSLSESKHLSINLYESYNQIKFIYAGSDFYYKSFLYEVGYDILVDKEIFYNNLIKNSYCIIDKNFNFANCIISGSFVTKNLLTKGDKIQSNDVDIFVLNNDIDVVSDILNYLIGFANKNTIIVQKYQRIINVIFDNINIQIIVTHAKNGFDVINQFDLDIVKVFIQNGNVYCNYGFIMSLRFMLCTTTRYLSNNKHIHSRDFKRIIKYTIHKEYFGIHRKSFINLYEKMTRCDLSDETNDIDDELLSKKLSNFWSGEKKITNLSFQEKLNYFIEEYENRRINFYDDVKQFDMFPNRTHKNESVIIYRAAQRIFDKKIEFMLSICYLQNYDKEYIVSLINLKRMDDEYNIIMNKIIEYNDENDVNKKSLKENQFYDFENIDINCNYTRDTFTSYHLNNVIITHFPFMFELNISNVIIDNIYRKKNDINKFFYCIVIKKNNIVNNNFFNHISKLNYYVFDKHRQTNILNTNKYGDYIVFNKLYMQDKSYGFQELNNVMSEYNFDKFNLFKETIFSTSSIFIKSYKLINIEDTNAKPFIFNKINASISIQPILMINNKSKQIYLKYTFTKIILNNYDI